MRLCWLHEQVQKWSKSCNWHNSQRCHMEKQMLLHDQSLTPFASGRIYPSPDVGVSLHRNQIPIPWRCRYLPTCSDGPHFASTKETLDEQSSPAVSCWSRILQPTANVAQSWLTLSTHLQSTARCATNRISATHVTRHHSVRPCRWRNRLRPSHARCMVFEIWHVRASSPEASSNRCWRTWPATSTSHPRRHQAAPPRRTTVSLSSSMRMALCCIMLSFLSVLLCFIDSLMFAERWELVVSRDVSCVRRVVCCVRARVVWRRCRNR